MTEMQCVEGSRTLKDEIVFGLIQKTDSGYYRSVDILKPTEDQRQSARRCLLEVEKHFTPADRNYIKGAAFILLRHFYEKNMTDQEYSAIAQDWIDVLSRFPAWVIKEARIEYLSKFKKKPVPADISELCEKSFSRAHALKAQCRKVLDAPVDVEQEITEAERLEMLSRISQAVENVKKELIDGGL